MPTILRLDGYRFYFFSHEPNEPPHVHVDKAEKSAKFWLDPVGLVKSFGYNSKELNEIIQLIEANAEYLLEQWYEYFEVR